MPLEIVVPKMGLTETHATVVRWLRSAGDRVTAGEVIAEVEADKADFEIEAPADGVLAEILVAEGTAVELGTPIARLAAEGETLEHEAASAEVALPAAAAPAAAAPARAVPRARSVPASPLARRVAAELGIDVEQLTGTGPGGLVVERDARAAAALNGPPSDVRRLPDLAGVGPLRELELSRVRRATARRLVAAAAIPTVTLHRRVEIEQARAAVAVARAAGVQATLTHAIMDACAHVLPRFPELNGFWIDDRLLTAERVNLGVAVDTPDGLLVAVVDDCVRRSLADIAVEAQRAVEQVRGGSVTPTTQATFTISNLGMLGVEHFSPLLNPPETGILGVGAVCDGRLGLSLTFDHRAIDGAPAARFLAELERELG